MTFISYPDPRLALKAEPAPVDDALRAIGARLLAANAEAAAYGLAAAHLGEVAPVIVLNTAPDGEERNDVLFYNPKIVLVADTTELGPEASVSLPGAQIDLPRPVWAEIAYDDGEGKPQTIRLEGFMARVALHEIDQMNGVYFLSGLSKLKRDMMIKKSEKYRRRVAAVPAAAPTTAG
jgi:peptide deformylase